MAGDTLPKYQQYPNVAALLAGVLLARGWDPTDPALTRLVEQPDARELCSQLRVTYERARADAKSIRRVQAPSGGPRWARAFDALLMLRHRQRAALSLAYVAGVPLDQVAEALTLREQDLRAVLDAGLAGIAKILDEAADVRGALRRAGARLVAAPAEHAPATARVDAPNTSTAVERFLARAELEAVEIVPPRGTPVAVLLGEIGPEARPRRRIPWRHALPAAALFVLVVAALGPLHAGELRAPSQKGVITVAPHYQAPADLGARVLAVRIWRVRSGDTLWSIARRALDDANSWPLIWEANRGRAMPGGPRFTDPDLIEPGWTLVLPSPD